MSHSILEPYLSQLAFLRTATSRGMAQFVPTKSREFFPRGGGIPQTGGGIPKTSGSALSQGKEFRGVSKSVRNEVDGMNEQGDIKIRGSVGGNADYNSDLDLDMDEHNVRGEEMEEGKHVEPNPSTTPEVRQEIKKTLVKKNRQDSNKTTAKVRPRKETTRLNTEPTLDDLRTAQAERIEQTERIAQAERIEQEHKDIGGGRQKSKEDRQRNVKVDDPTKQKEKRQQNAVDTRNQKRLEDTASRRGQGSTDGEVKVSDKDVQERNKMLQQGIDNRQEGVNYTLHKIDQKYVNNLMKGDGKRGDINAQDVKTYFERVSKGYPDWIRGQAKSVVLIHKESGKFKLIRSTALLKGADKKDLSGYEGINIPLALFKKLTGSK